MESLGDERRLTTILALDVVGYSRLMRENESTTLAALKADRKELIEPKTAQYRGRTIKLMGDGAMMEFASVVDAVAFAVEIQCAMRAREADVPEARRMQYRIGINIGDIIVEDADIYGNGVNVAARLEGLAEAGGISVSRDVFSQVKAKLDLTFECLGDKKMKNISEPITVYRVVLDDRASALATPVTRDVRRAPAPNAILTAALIVALLIVGGGLVWWAPWSVTPVATIEGGESLPLPDKPSIAVLPFENLSGDAAQTYLSDGLSEDIITELARFTDLFVIARNSSFQYRGTSVDVRRVGRELGVRYVLEGSLQRSDDKIRVTAQLINVTSNTHIWSERYDRALTEVFEVQSDIARQIAAAIGTAYGGAISRQEAAQDTMGASTRFQAYDLLLRGMSSIDKFTEEDVRIGRALFLEAIELRPDYAKAYAKLAISYFIEYVIGASEAEVALPELTRYANLAVEADRFEPWAYWARAYSHLYAQKDYDTALLDFEKALSFNPNDADILSEYGWALSWAGRAEEGVKRMKEAMRLNPHYPNWYLDNLKNGYLVLRDHENVIATITQSTRLGRTDHAYLAASYARLGQSKKAQEQVRALLADDPELTIARYVATRRFKLEDDRNYFIESLRLAGLPD